MSGYGEKRDDIGSRATVWDSVLFVSPTSCGLWASEQGVIR